MRKALFLSLFGALALNAHLQAQEPVLIAGGSTPITPIVVTQPAPAVQAVPAVPVVYVPVPVAPVVYAPPVQIVSGGYCNPPNVIYFGGPNSCYNASYYGGYYGGYGRPGCSYNPSVIYFGRGEACQRGYAFTYPR